MSIENRDNSSSQQRESIGMVTAERLNQASVTQPVVPFIASYPCEIETICMIGAGLSNSPQFFLSIARILPSGVTLIPITVATFIPDFLTPTAPVIVPVIPNSIMIENDTVLGTINTAVNVAADKYLIQMVVRKLQDRVTYFGK